MISESPLLALVFLLGSNLITGISSSMQRIGKSQVEAIAKRQGGPAKWLFKKERRDQLSYALTIAKHLLLVCFALSAWTFSLQFFAENPNATASLAATCIVLGSFLLSDYLFQMISLHRPRLFFRALCQIGSLLLWLLWPISSPLFGILKQSLPQAKGFTSLRMKDKILELLHDSEFAPYMDPQDQKLILSVISFKVRIAREIMVPRIDLFTLSADTSVKEAAQSFLEEGYSRIPVWKDSVDNIIGALYYKDLLNLYFTSPQDQTLLEKPIERFLKPILYTPETKRISQLLQEFRSKQIHLAIVVDEYGGTEGIATIEDILEELVGEIADEYDSDEQALYTPLPSGGWIIDAKMAIIDLEKELGIKIPQNPEYDSIGGYIFHKAGAIPQKGWRLHHDDFDLEVLSSSERTVEKIRVTTH